MQEDTERRRYIDSVLQRRASEVTLAAEAAQLPNQSEVPQTELSRRIARPLNVEVTAESLPIMGQMTQEEIESANAVAIAELNAIAETEKSNWVGTWSIPTLGFSMDSAMIYLLAALMGYLVGNNYQVQKKMRIVGTYSHTTLNALSNLGGFGGWFCILPAAVIVGEAYSYNVMSGVLFVAAAFVGSFASGMVSIESVFGRARAFVAGYFLSALTLPVNAGLALYLYVKLH